MKRTPIRPRSKKKIKQMREAKKQVERLIEERGNRCQVGERLAAWSWNHRIPDYCARKAQGRHHLRKQSAQGSDADENILLSCNWCNDYVESESDIAKSAGLVVRQGDERWEKLGK